MGLVARMSDSVFGWIRSSRRSAEYWLGDSRDENDIARCHIERVSNIQNTCG